jgi:hypothetical protein
MRTQERHPNCSTEFRKALNLSHLTFAIHIFETTDRPQFLSLFVILIRSPQIWWSLKILCGVTSDSLSPLIVNQPSNPHLVNLMQ